MSNNWHQAYLELTEFIAGHPAIEIEPGHIRLPDDVRPGFYRLFDKTRIGLIEEKLPDLLEEAALLSRSYIKAEEEVTGLLGLEDISVSPSLYELLHEPVNKIRKGAFDPLFDLLQGRISIAEFEEKAMQNITASFLPLYQLGYEKWVVLSLLKPLGADRLYQTPPPKIAMYDTHKKGGAISEKVPSPAESKSIAFNYSPNDPFMAPDLIIHSAKIDRYIAVRSQISQPFCIARNPSEDRQWLPFDPVKLIEPGLTLVYIADNLDEVSIAADANKVCQPDLILECKGMGDWYKKDWLGRVKLHSEHLKPQLGTYVISPQQIPEQYTAGLEDGIRLLEAGMERDKLEPVVSAILSCRNK